MIMTEATLAELHPELVEKLKAVHGKPLMITVTYKDEADQLQYFICMNNDFNYEDGVITMNHLTEQIDKNHKPRNVEVIQDIKKQFQVRKPVQLRG